MPAGQFPYLEILIAQLPTKPHLSEFFEKMRELNNKRSTIRGIHHPGGGYTWTKYGQECNKLREKIEKRNLPHEDSRLLHGSLNDMLGEIQPNFRELENEVVRIMAESRHTPQQFINPTPVVPTQQASQVISRSAPVAPLPSYREATKNDLPSYQQFQEGHQEQHLRSQALPQSQTNRVLPGVASQNLPPQTPHLPTTHIQKPPRSRS